MSTVKDIEEKTDAAVGKMSHLQRIGLFPTGGVFYPSIHYPPFTMNGPLTTEAFYEDYEPPGDGLFDVYVHVPFCVRQCVFCHIPVVTGADLATKERYIDAVLAEMDLFQDRVGQTRIPTRSVLLGGGTATDMPPATLDRFLRSFRSRLDLEACTQISVDLDPATVLGEAGLERLDILRRAGVGRLAFGVQSMDDATLRHMNRAHGSSGVKEAVRRSKEAGFKVNIEIIFGYPRETLDSWFRVMEQVLALEVDEVQIYRLKVEPYRERAGRIVNEFSRDASIFPSVEETVRMQEMSTRMLEEGGYRENMRRFFTRTPEDYSHYFFNYTTKLHAQIGFGQTACHSFRDRFGQNAIDLEAYQDEVARGRLPVRLGLLRDEETQLRWAFTKPLRYYEANREVFRRHTGLDLDDVFKEKVALLMDEGLIERTDPGLKLTRWGAFFADEVAQQFHHPRYLVNPRDAYEGGPLNPYRNVEP